MVNRIARAVVVVELPTYIGGTDFIHGLFAEQINALRIARW